MKTEDTGNVKPPKRLAKFHGDVVTSLIISPIGNLIATTSLDGWFHVYNVDNKQLLFMHNFKEPITSSIWFSKNVNDTITVVTSNLSKLFFEIEEI